MKQRHLMRQSLRGGLLGGVALSLLATAAYAQQTPPPAGEQPAAAEAEAEEEGEPAMDEIVVVGSRIRRDTFSSASPIQVITREESTLAGLSSAAEILQDNSVGGGTQQINNAFGGFVVQGGPGVNTVSLRGLGAGRTLVLINNRRVAPAGTRGSVGATDLNVLPNAMIERIDILRDGASSIYGSDAVAGVVNVVTRTDIDGVIVEGQFNQPIDDGGEQGRISVVGGKSGDRWKVAGSVEYYQREDLTVGERGWASDCPTDNRINRATGTSLDFIDPLTGQPKCWTLDAGGVTINTLGTRNRTGVGAAGSVGTAFNRWRPNSAVTTGLVGYEGVGGGANNLNVRDTFDPRTLNESLISPVEVWTGFGQASYEIDILGDAEIYTEVLFNRRESSQIGFRQLSLDYPQTSPLVPANLQTEGANFGSQLHSGAGLRAFIGFGNDESSQTVEYYKGNLGVRGDLAFLPDWQYDIFASYAKSDAEYTFESFLTDRLRNSVNVVAATPGTPANLTRVAANGTTVMCGVTATNPALGCIPAPILNSQTLAGVLPLDFTNYIFVPVTGTTSFDEFNFAISADGPIFKLPAGDVSVAVGAEYRWSEIDDTPPVDSQNGNLLNLTSAALTRGSDSVVEVFGEVDVPILAKMPFVNELSLQASGRFTEYDSYGSDWTYKIGGYYEPVDFFSIRASYGTSYRAPALFEQFQGATSGFLSSNSDPCNNYGAPNVNPNRAANCAAELPGQPTFLATSGIAVLTQGGADTGLEAETSDNIAIGAVFRPELPEPFGEFAFAVDYFDIEINNGVAQAGAGNILALCYDDPQFRAGGGFCDLVSRAAGSNQLTVINSFTNIATEVVKGFDYSLRWTGEVGPGSLRVNASVTRYISQASKLFEDDPLEEANGILNNPEIVAQLDLTYRWQEWTFRYGLDWVDSMDSYDFFGLDRNTTQFILDVPSYDLHDVSVQYSEEDWSLTVGVRNVFDKEPPRISSGAISIVGNAPLYSGYDYVGRQVFLNLQKEF